MTLHKLTGQFVQVYDWGSDPDMDPDVWYDTLDSIEMDIKDKSQNIAIVIKQHEGDSETLKNEIDRLSARKKAIDNSVVRLKQYLQNSMEATGLAKFKTDLFSFNIQNNAPSVVLDEQYIENVPQEYLKFKDPEIDKKKIAEDLKAGKDLNGLAHFEQTRSLRIR